MNQVTLCGNLSRDFQLSYAQNGVAYTKNSLAISKRTTSKEGNQTTTKDRTDWIPLTIFGKRAAIAHQYFKKGDSKEFYEDFKVFKIKS
ncbi:single-stranded DNA-binding protein [Helicobacter sp.]|uniref:single-stranded DNA-binding protein n=1 Tax=Helicobacter sp. TaxID=218 RepID=UPI0025BB3288|nr:single-stranded DNA-binding protein [Helicobacter sp.]MCI5633249.1 single-stranded DNA-binding protein [Helicobacter sp.]